MDIEQFIITIQWGKGMHYIASTCATSERAKELLLFHKKHCDKKNFINKRGAKATVRSWKLVEEK